MRVSGSGPARALAQRFAQPQTPRRPAPASGLGDVNGDGVIDENDVELVNLHVQGVQSLTGRSLRVADVDGDGQVTANDANLISDFINGGLARFPAQSG